MTTRHTWRFCRPMPSPLQGEHAACDEQRHVTIFMAQESNWLTRVICVPTRGDGRGGRSGCGHLRWRRRIHWGTLSPCWVVCPRLRGHGVATRTVMSADKHGHGYTDSKHQRFSTRGHGTRHSATKNGHTPSGSSPTGRIVRPRSVGRHASLTKTALNIGTS